MDQEIRSAAHDLLNLVARLTFLAETLDRHLPAAPAKTEAAELLADTMAQMNKIAVRLRGLSARQESPNA